jgi:NADH dehydrogenase
MLSHREIVALVLAAAGRARPILSVPSPLVNRVLRAAEVLLKSRAPATWDEAELLEVSMTSAAGMADVVGLGITPRPMAAVLGLMTPAPVAR